MQDFVRITNGCITRSFLRGCTLDELLKEFPNSDKKELETAYKLEHKNDSATVQAKGSGNKRKSD